MGLMEKIEAAQLKSDRPELRPGDTVEVAVRVIEGDKERQQKFRGEIKVLKHSKVRRAKLFYLRHKTGKAARLTEKKTVARERAPKE